MKNIKELREELIAVFDGLRKGTLDVKIASEMSSAAGKIIRSLAIQLNYFSLRKEKPNINFLNEK